MALWTRGGDPWTKRQGDGVGTAQWGVMVGSVFELLLTDLLREGWAKEARELQNTVERRLGVWLRMPFPYGSEFPFDNTGHEARTCAMRRRAARRRGVNERSGTASVWSNCLG